MSTEEEDEALRQELREDTEALHGVAQEITEAEEFKHHCAQAAELAFVVLKPFLVGAATAQGGPVAGQVAEVAGNLIAKRLHELAQTEDASNGQDH